MAITVKFFASLHEQIGVSETQLAHDSVRTVLDAWQQSTSDAQLPVNTLCAINMKYSKLDQAVNDGDEVAFFPPVTGG